MTIKKGNNMAEDRSEQYLKAINPDNGLIHVGEKGAKTVSIDGLSAGHYKAGAYKAVFDIDKEAKLSASASEKVDVPEFDVAPATTTTTTKAPETTTTTTTTAKA